ncbi:MAG TPA: hypothetical protein VGD80_41700 [Kofleriaceae bacterium]
MASIIARRAFQPMPSSPAISSSRPIVSARAAGSSGSTTSGPARRAASAVIAAQLVRAGSLL